MVSPSDKGQALTKSAQAKQQRIARIEAYNARRKFGSTPQGEFTYYDGDPVATGQQPSKITHGVGKGLREAEEPPPPVLVCDRPTIASVVPDSGVNPGDGDVVFTVTYNNPLPDDIFVMAPSDGGFTPLVLVTSVIGVGSADLTFNVPATARQTEYTLTIARASDPLVCNANGSVMIGDCSLVVDAVMFVGDLEVGNFSQVVITGSGFDTLAVPVVVFLETSQDPTTPDLMLVGAPQSWFPLGFVVDSPTQITVDVNPPLGTTGFSYNAVVGDLPPMGAPTCLDFGFAGEVEVDDMCPVELVSVAGLPPVIAPGSGPWVATVTGSGFLSGPLLVNVENTMTPGILSPVSHMVIDDNTMTVTFNATVVGDGFLPAPVGFYQLRVTQTLDMCSDILNPFVRIGFA